MTEHSWSLATYGACGCDQCRYHGASYQGVGVRCECHECTQARWKMSLLGQMERAMQSKVSTDPPSASETHSEKEK